MNSWLDRLSYKTGVVLNEVKYYSILRRKKTN